MSRAIPIVTEWVATVYDGDSSPTISVIQKVVGGPLEHRGKTITLVVPIRQALEEAKRILRYEPEDE